MTDRSALIYFIFRAAMLSGAMALSGCNSDGSNGANGATGATGTAGLNTLVETVPEPDGAHCSNGGTKTTSGLDANGDGILETSEVTNTSYVCNGIPGGLSWLDVTAPAEQMVSNAGYIADDNSAKVVFTLPASSSMTVGDVLRIKGASLDGWSIAQNSDQSIVIDGVPSYIEDGQTPWTHQTSSLPPSGDVGRAVASSSDGTHLVTAMSGGLIYTSDDGGATWTPHATVQNWYGVASSADGTHLVAVVSGGQIYTSSDSGVTWMPQATVQNWGRVASSADGTHLVANVYNGQLYTSSDSGVTWIPRATTQNWIGVTSSADGTHLAAVVYNGQIYTSTDSGITWAPGATPQPWGSIASSADGTHLVAVPESGQIYTSSDSGVTWTPRATAQNWSGVASSSDGIHLIAGVFRQPAGGANAGQIYTSSDSGETWILQTMSPMMQWTGFALSSDGTHQVAVDFAGEIYTSVAIANANLSTAVGTTGSFGGGPYDSLELIYLGSGTFGIQSFVGTDFTSH